MSDWYYYKNNEKIGPISTSEIKTLAKNGFITQETVIENVNGRSAVTGKVKGLTFRESKAPPLPCNVLESPMDDNPFTEPMPDVRDFNPFTETLPDTPTPANPFAIPMPDNTEPASEPACNLSDSINNLLDYSFRQQPTVGIIVFIFVIALAILISKSGIHL